MKRNATMRARCTPWIGALLGAVLMSTSGCDRPGLGGDPTAPPGLEAAFSKTEPLPADLTVLAEYVSPSNARGAAVATAVIGAGGGTLRLGDIEIVVPAGAVDRSTMFQIRLPPAEAGKRVLAEFLPHNVDFAVPVLLRLPHAGTTAEEGAPVLWWNGREWEAQPTTFLGDGRSETPVRHFSFYGKSAMRGYTLAGG